MMPDAQPRTEPPPPPATVSLDADALRIVLFGMPDAGKSSLLGALAQAAQTQEKSLGGRLSDLSHGLEALQRRLYDERPRETLEEVVPYPAAFDPFEGAKPDPSRRDELVLVDCDGRVANELLTNRRGIAYDPPAGSLAAEVLGADALFLVVDAGATPGQVDNDLAEFVRFLRLFQRDRGRRSEVGGLPVFLVLSKCDLLARPGDAEADWKERIAAKKQEVARRFKHFLDDDTDDERLPFGAIDLELAATAVKRPALAGTPAQPREPWGVAQLFRDGLAAAQSFRRRRSASQRRLTWTVAGASALFVSLAAFVVGLVLTRESMQPVALAAVVESYRAREGLTASSRLGEPLQKKYSELSDVRSSAEFAKLSEEQQQFVAGRLAELESYIDYKDRLVRLRPPAEARTEDELREIERELNGDLALPPDHKDEWRQTEAALLREKWLDDTKAIRKAVGEVGDWYAGLTAEGNRLLVFGDRGSDAAPLPWTSWADGVATLLRKATQPPFRPGDRLRESRPLPQALPGGRAVLYETALRFASVEPARVQWDRLRQRLERLRDVTQALGLAGDGSRAVLRFSESPRFTAAQAGEVLQSLKQLYPRAAEWSLDDLPDAAVAEVRQAAQVSYLRVIQAGREVVARRFLQIAPDGQETLQRWQQVAEWLPGATELRDWRELANLLLRLTDPSAEDPVPALAGFLRRDRFEIELRGLRLHVPYDLKGVSVRPAGKLLIAVQAADRTVTRLTFRLDGEGTRDPRRRATTFALTFEGLGATPYRPGDILWAEVPLRDPTGREWTFSWWAVPIRSALYQFERLALPPRLHRTGEKIEAGDVAEGVTVSSVPEAGLPRVPDLLPERK